MIEDNKKIIIKKISLFKNSDLTNNKLIQNHISYSDLNNINRKTDNLSKSKDTKKSNFNIIQFISQKNKFSLENDFDMKGTKKFLASREIAMKKINLNDEINEKVKLDNKNLKMKKSVKTITRSISPKRSKKIFQKSHKELKFFNKKETSIKKSKNSKRKSKKNRFTFIKCEKSSSDLESNSDNCKKGNISIFIKEDNDDIYKFIIENADEQDHIFEKKLNKELKKLEKQNKEKIKNKTKKRNTIVAGKKVSYKSSFKFSEINKNNMSNDNLNLSSIGEDKNYLLSPNYNRNNNKRIFGSIQINDQKIKDRIINKIKFEEKSNNDINSSEINSDKKSLINILSNLK